ncbi:SLAM family member 9 isoform 2-T5 [Spinachia spinachia]
MAAGCRRGFFACVSVLLLGGRLYDVEASRCDGVIYKTVGDAVELPSCAPTTGVTDAEWIYQGSNVQERIYEDSITAEATCKGLNIPVNPTSQFEGRLDLSCTSFNLTVRQLTRRDSGLFRFVSDVKNYQRATVTINLTVYEPISKEPAVTLNCTWDAKSSSWKVTLTCSATSDSGVTYTWRVNNETMSGSRVEHTITPRDGGATFTCTASNVVSEKSKSMTAKCGNATTQASHMVPVLGAAGAAGLMLVVAVGVAVCVCHRKRGPADPPAGSHPADSTLYADIAEVAIGAGSSLPVGTGTVYETIADPVKPGPQAVYDKIQFHRARRPSVSPYQEVS